MAREIKFRVWDKSENKMSYSNTEFFDDMIGFRFSHWGIDVDSIEDIGLMQFTGLLDKNGKEVYEGDVRREEEETERGDIREYYVMTWINEWSMFAWLHLPGEYDDYLDNGADHLDTTLFWTYPAQADESNKIIICGNIYETAELLNP